MHLVKLIIFCFYSLRDGWKIQHSQSIGAPAVQVHWHGSCRYNKIRVVGKPAQGFLQHVHGTSWLTQLLCHCWKRIESKSQIQYYGENAPALWSTSRKTRRLEIHFYSSIYIYIYILFFLTVLIVYRRQQ